MDLYIYIIIVFIFYLLFINCNVEEFKVSTQFWEQSDNYSMLNRISFYDRLRCIFGGNCNNNCNYNLYY